MRKTEIRLVCDLCGQQSPVLEGPYVFPKNWSEWVTEDNHAKAIDFCCEAHKNKWIEEHAEQLLTS